MSVKGKFRIPYEPPRIVDLTGGDAHAQLLLDKCQAGTGADSAKCQSGGSPGQQCKSGSTAYGASCQSGRVASQKCMTGGAPGA